ncbi:enediyne biosynthesis protein UnbU [Phycicoccus flavus]|uniref:enediyne biosynthesis protein UnbU n=1 Tax=Phycicoccus flavus TaxID=2502783 RepID=UPI00197B15EE|nr:enediyne biosynthesis protein UnbU [Phycicoccus flavus]
MTTTIDPPRTTTAPVPVGASTPAPTPAPAAPAPGKDPRYIALRNFALSISVFNVLGYWLLGFEQPYLWPVLAVLTAYVTELSFEALSAWATERPARFRGRGARGVYEFLLPAHITAVAVNMLLFANNQIWPVLLGVVAGVTAKHVLQAPIAGRMRHYMNPSNFGISVSLLLFGSWVSVAPPYQFSESVNSLFGIAICLVIATAGTTLNAALTRKIPLIAGWLGGFVIQAVVRHWLMDVSLTSALSVMTGIAFVLFTNYMISDPGTTPFPARAQFVFGASVAVVYGLLIAVNVVYTLFFAVTVVCLLRGLGWWVHHAVTLYRSRRFFERSEVLS